MIYSATAKKRPGKSLTQPHFPFWAIQEVALHPALHRRLRQHGIQRTLKAPLDQGKAVASRERGAASAARAPQNPQGERLGLQIVHVEKKPQFLNIPDAIGCQPLVSIPDPRDWVRWRQ
jgi:hypothetical protein